MKALSPAADMAWRIAAHEAAASGYKFIEKEHLLIGIVSIEKVIADGPGHAGLDQNAWQDLEVEHSLLKRVLRSHGIDQTKLRRIIRKKLGNGGYKHTEKTIHRSEECKAVFAKAADIPDLKLITTLHLAAAIAGNPGDILTTIFSELKVDPKALRDTLLSPPEESPVHANEDKRNNDASQSYLERYGRDLTQAARDGKLGPFVGRRDELLQVIQTLARSMKSNPVLVGEAGVGKTAIVEALAVRAIQGKDPQVLSGKKIIELNIGAILGGTKYRGEFEERLTRIIEERKILIPMLEEISADIKNRYNVSLRFAEEVESFLTQKGFSPHYGVRELRRTVEKYIQMPLSNLILNGKFREHNSWLADLENGSISFLPVEEKIN